MVKKAKKKVAEEAKEKIPEEIEQEAAEVEDEQQVVVEIEPCYEDKLKYVSPMAHPMAPRKLAKHLHKLAKKAKKKNELGLRVGIKTLRKCIRKGEKGIVILSGDSDPIDVISFFPVLCEENDIPYCWTPSKKDLGNSLGTNRPACAVMIKPLDAYQDAYDKCLTEVTALPMPVNT